MSVNWTELMRGLAAVGAAFLVLGVLLALAGFNPIRAYVALVNGSIGSLHGIGETLVRATPLLVIGLGTSIAFRAGLWNIGGEGQLLVGAIGATAVALYAPELPRVLHLPMVMAAGLLAGAGWAAIAGYMRARWDANEIVVTIMMNYLAANLLSYLVSGPMKDTTRFAPVPRTALLPESAYLPGLIPSTRVHAGTIVALAAVGAVWFLLNRTVLGYEIKATGSNLVAASQGGIEVRRICLLAMALSGALAGLAGAIQISAIHRQLMEGISPGYGYLAVAVALFAGLNPIGVVFSALFFGALLVGADSMHRSVGVPIATVYLLQGLALVFVLARGVLERRREPARQPTLREE